MFFFVFQSAFVRFLDIEQRARVLLKKVKRNIIINRFICGMSALDRLFVEIEKKNTKQLVRSFVRSVLLKSSTFPF